MEQIKLVKTEKGSVLLLVLVLLGIFATLAGIALALIIQQKQFVNELKNQFAADNNSFYNSQINVNNYLNTGMFSIGASEGIPFCSPSPVTAPMGNNCYQCKSQYGVIIYNQLLSNNPSYPLTNPPSSGWQTWFNNAVTYSGSSQAALIEYACCSPGKNFNSSQQNYTANDPQGNSFMQFRYTGQGVNSTGNNLNYYSTYVNSNTKGTYYSDSTGYYVQLFASVQADTSVNPQPSSCCTHAYYDSGYGGTLCSGYATNQYGGIPYGSNGSSQDIKVAPFSSAQFYQLGQPGTPPYNGCWPDVTGSNACVPTASCQVDCAGNVRVCVSGPSGGQNANSTAVSPGPTTSPAQVGNNAACQQQCGVWVLPNNNNVSSVSMYTSVGSYIFSCHPTGNKNLNPNITQCVVEN